MLSNILGLILDGHVGKDLFHLPLTETVHTMMELVELMFMGVLELKDFVNQLTLFPLPKLLVVIELLAHTFIRI
jgi:hypothetical protein